MLRTFDFDNVDRTYADYKKKDLEKELARLQRRLIATDKSLLILVDGWESSGKGDVLRAIVHEMDQRYFETSVFDEPTDEEKKHPFLWRFMRRMPKKGSIGVFDRSFYFELMTDIDGDDETIDRKISHISVIENWLPAAGTAIVKLFLHHTKDTMGKRVKKLIERGRPDHPDMERDRRQWKEYDRYFEHFDHILEKTDNGNPWHVISTEDPKLAAKTALGITAKILREHLDDAEKPSVPRLPAYDKKPLDAVDFTATLSEEEYDAVLDDLQEKARDLVFRMYLEEKSAVVAFEGTDAAGKGGAIRRLLKEVDPRGYDVATTAAPSREENQYHYLWRFYRTFPIVGWLIVYDRSWYGRVLVERIEGFTPEHRWKQAYGEIAQMEKTLVEDGLLVIKFLLLIDSDEQMRRFRDRESDPTKAYKITEEDWRNREKFDAYTDAMNDMVAYTDTPHAPWILVDGQDKKHARIAVLREFTSRLETFLDGEKR